MAYYELEPFGEERADLRMGVMAALVGNIHRKKGKRSLTPKDFMPKFGRRRKKQTVSEMFGKLMAVTKLHKTMFGDKPSRR